MATFTPQHGDTLYISITSTGEVIAGTKSNEIQNQCDLLEKSTDTSTQWKEFMAGRKEWSFTVGMLISSTSSLDQLLMVGNSYTITLRRGNAVLRTGTAICQQCKITATKGSLVQGSFTFKGSGALS